MESYLGRIDVGWSVDGEGGRLNFQVVRFSADVAGGIPFSTLGVSRYRLKSPSANVIRQELLMLVPRSLGDGPVPSILRQVGEDVIKSGTALLRGDVIGPKGKVFDRSTMEALYVASPVYLPDGFAVCQTSDDPVVMTWLVPITHAEAHFIFANGWSKFEDYLVEFDPDLVNIYRESIF
jgi:hypothetical protein